ncbi:hypothetical protein EJB05_15503, partial [Eragrostis curvula]
MNPTGYYRSTPLKRNLVLEICKVFWVERFFFWVFVPDACNTRVLMEDFLHCRAWGEAKLLASVDPSRWLLQHGKAGLRVRYDDCLHDPLRVPDSRMSPEQTLCQDSALEQHCP